MVDHTIIISSSIVDDHPIIKSHLPPESSWLPRNALLGDEERVEAAKTGGVSTPPFNST